MLVFSVCLKMFVTVNKIVKALQASKDSELGQVKRIAKYSCGRLMLALTSNAFRRLKANKNNKKTPKKFKLEILRKKDLEKRTPADKTVTHAYYTCNIKDLQYRVKPQYNPKWEGKCLEILFPGLMTEKD